MIQCPGLVRVHVDSKVQSVLKPVQRAGTEITAFTSVTAWMMHLVITWMARVLVHQVGLAWTARKAALLVITECSVLRGVSAVKMAQKSQHLAILWQDYAIVYLDIKVTGIRFRFFTFLLGLCQCSENGTEVLTSCDSMTGLCNCIPVYLSWRS